MFDLSQKKNFSTNLKLKKPLLMSFIPHKLMINKKFDNFDFHKSEIVNKKLKN